MVSIAVLGVDIAELVRQNSWMKSLIEMSDAHQMELTRVEDPKIAPYRRSHINSGFGISSLEALFHSFNLISAVSVI